jgi:hypothetical protein
MGRRSKPEFEVKKSAVPNGDLSWFIIGRPNGRRVRAWFPSKEKAQAEAKERNIKMRKLGEVAAWGRQRADRDGDGRGNAPSPVWKDASGMR